jgi:hypothetical protein
MAPLISFVGVALHASVALGLDGGRPTLAPIGPYLATTDMLWSWSASGIALPNGSRVLDPLAPVQWYQAAYVGNGLVGALVTAVASGSLTPSLRFDVSRTDVWGPCQNRLPAGYFTLSLAPPRVLARVDARLVLTNATLVINLTSAQGDGATLRIFSNAADPMHGAGGLLVSEAWAFGASGPPPITWEFAPDTSGACSNATVMSGQEADPWGAPTVWATQSSPSGSFSIGAWLAESRTERGLGGRSLPFL